MSFSTPRPARRKWNTKYNWIVALVGALLAGGLIFVYQWVWLPLVFADLLSRGMPGEGGDAARVYFWTAVIFALPGVAMVLATLLWHFRTSWTTRILVLIVASVWFVLGSTSGLGRYTGGSRAETRRGILIRAGAELPVAEAWSHALFIGSLIGMLLGMSVLVFVLVRTIKGAGQRTLTD